MSRSRRGELARLRRLAAAHQVQPSYTDLDEHEIWASPDSLIAVLRAMGAVESLRDVPDALARRQHERWHWAIEPVSVAWDGRLAGVEIGLPRAAASAAALCRLEYEDGDADEWTLRLADATVAGRAEIGGAAYVSLRLALPDGMPPGYHRFSVEAAGHRLETLVVSAPRLAFRAPERRQWGVFLPLYALHSSRSLGIGDFTDLDRLIEWAASKGAGFAGTLPLLASFLDTPYAHSPYEPVSRLFWNEIYVDPTAPLGDTPAPPVDDALLRKLRAHNSATDVAYREVMAIKRRVMQQQAAALEGPACEALGAYVDSRPAVGEYAAFRGAVERLGPSWRDWPAAARAGRLHPGDYDEDTAAYYRFAQWRAGQQIRQVADTVHARGERFYLDMPVGVHTDGYDAWRYQHLFAPGMIVGAPPDLLNTEGQVWGFQPLDPTALRRHRYEYVIDYLRHVLAVAGMLRVDHAIGLHRIYWIPGGATGRDGVFVRQPADELYAILCLESHRNQAVIVGEDLGLVPPEVGRGLREHAINGMYVQMFQMTGKPEAPQSRVPELSIASFSTHDLPTFPAYWLNQDLRDRERLGLLSPPRVAEEVAGRKKTNDALLAHLQQRGLAAAGASAAEAYRGATALLAESDADWLLINLEDTWGETRAHNLPGTTAEQHPNWTVRARYRLEDFDSLEDLRKTFDVVRRLRPSRAKGEAT